MKFKDFEKSTAIVVGKHRHVSACVVRHLSDPTC